MKALSLPNYKLLPDRLRDFGFAETDDGCRYTTDLLGGQLQMTVWIAKSGALGTEVRDAETGAEYVLHHVPDAAGAFVGQVRDAYDAVLQSVLAACFTSVIYKSGDAGHIIQYVRTRYGDELEHLWAKTPANAVWRRKDNGKWYGALLVIPRRKLGLPSDEPVEIVDLRMAPEQLAALVDNQRYFPGYHMNKQHWLTICLDGSVPRAEICRYLDESYLLAGKK